MSWRKTWILDTGRAVQGIIATLAAFLVAWSFVSIAVKGGFLYESVEPTGERTTVRFGGEVVAVKAKGDTPSAKP